MPYTKIDRNRKYSGIGADTVAGTRGYVAWHATFAATEAEREAANADLIWFRERYPESTEEKFRAARHTTARRGAAAEEAASDV